MSDAANVRSIHALAELREALGRFAEGACDPLRAAEIETQRTLDYLGERMRHWQREFIRRQAMLVEAERALRGCQAAAAESDGRVSCGPQELAVLNAQVALRQAEANLQTVAGWRRIVEKAAEDFGQRARALGAVLDGDVPRARKLLEAGVTTLEDYVRLSPSSGRSFSAPPPVRSDAGPAPSNARSASGSVEAGHGGTEREVGPEASEGGIGGPERGF